MPLHRPSKKREGRHTDRESPDNTPVDKEKRSLSCLGFFRNRRGKATPASSPHRGRSLSPLVKNKVEDGISDDETHTTRDHGIRTLLGDTIKMIIETTKEVSDPFPPLKAAAAGVSLVLKNVDVMNDNVNETARLVKRAEELAAENAKWAVRDGVDDTMKSAMLQISEKITAQCSELKQGAERRGWIRFIQGSRDAADLKGKDDAIKEAFEKFQRALLESVKEDTSNIKKNVCNVITGQEDVAKKRCLDKLERYCSKSAPFTAGIEDKRLARTICAPRTRVNILKEIRDWIEHDVDQQLYWLTGHAGSGKSTIAYTICQAMAEDCPDIPLVSYFCSRQLDSGSSSLLLPTLCQSLAECDGNYADKLADRIGSRQALLTAQVPIQTRELLARPWSNCRSQSAPIVVVVVDALDENEGGYAFLDELLTAVDGGKMTGIKFMITSRTEGKIEARCARLPRCRLQDVPTDEVDGDINKYLKAELIDCDPKSLEAITSKAGGLFIYAATVVRIVAPPGSTSDEQRRTVSNWLDDAALVTAAEDDIPPLHSLYLSIIQEWLKNASNRSTRDTRLRILHTILTAKVPIPAVVVASLVGVDITKGDVEGVVRYLHGVLRVPNENAPIYWYHASFQDFMFTQLPNHLSSPIRSYDYVCSRSAHNALLAQSCFRILHERLRFNICGLGSSYQLDQEIEDLDDRVARSIDQSVAYCCRHWTRHLTTAVKAAETGEGRTWLPLLEKLERFGKERALFWIEAMNLLKAKQECYSAVKDVQALLLECGASNELRSITMAVERVASSFTQTPTALSTPHLYISSLAIQFSTTVVPQEWRDSFPGIPRVECVGLGSHGRALTSIPMESEVISATFTPDGLHVVSGLEDNSIHIWDASTGKEMQKLEGHTSWVTSVAFSPDGLHVVSGSFDASIRIWDVSTGEEKQRLEGHTNCVSSVAFSPDDSHVVSGSVDNSIRIWDVSTGEEKQKLEGHTSFVSSIAFSPDGLHVVSGSVDNSIRIWDASTGKEKQKLEGHTSRVNSVAFSPDGLHVISGSDDYFIRIWDASTSKEKQKLEGHKGSVRSVAFSPDGLHVVSGSADKSIRIWDTSTGKEKQKLEGHTDWVNHVAFSPDGLHVISGSRDRSFRMWDPSTVEEKQKLEGHTNAVRSVAFSPDGLHVVSGSDDNSICIWDVSTGKEKQKLEGCTDRVRSVAFSPDGLHVISGSEDNSIRIWDASTGKEKQKLEGHKGSVNSVAFSPDGLHVVSGSFDTSIRIWDTSTGKEKQKQNYYTGIVNSVTFSPDGLHIISSTGFGPIRIWHASTGEEKQKLEGHTGWVNSVAFSPDGLHVVSGSADKSIRIWDVSTGEEKQKLEGHTSWVDHVAFSPDGLHVISGSGDNSIRIWDVSTGEEKQKLEGHTSSVTSVAVSPDGLHVVSGSIDNSIRIWDVSTGEEEQKLEGHTSLVSSVAFSPDDSHVVSGSDNNSVRLCGTGIGNGLGEVKWTLTPRGWIITCQSRQRLLWLPRYLHTGLYTNHCRLVVHRLGTTTLDFSAAHVGPDWVCCHNSNK